jgi:hypothetical protein
MRLHFAVTCRSREKIFGHTMSQRQIRGSRGNKKFLHGAKANGNNNNWKRKLLFCCCCFVVA